MSTSRRRFHLKRSVQLWLLVFVLMLFHTFVFAQEGSGVINPLNFPGSNLCQQIKAAIATNASTNPQGLVIDARSATSPQACDVNPFSGATVPGQLLLGAIVLRTTVPIVTPSVNAWQILGTGRGNNVNETGTLIQAVSGFPAGGKVVRLGDGTNPTFGNRIENLAIDCNGIGTIGLYSTDIPEESGGSNLVITSCPEREIWINGSGSDGTGSLFAMNYDFHDVECLALNAGTPATIACEFDGNNLIPSLTSCACNPSQTRIRRSMLLQVEPFFLTYSRDQGAYFFVMEAVHPVPRRSAVLVRQASQALQYLV